MSNADLPIALRPAVEFAPVRTSIFDDPGDEKSWHRSQRSESLSCYYEGREPSWYASAIAPLAGARRVLDLGCGPGLALRALLEQGAESAVGVDRWSAFATGPDAPAPVVAHDLTLPMPFLASGSFDGVLSHYALDYVSPIGMRQVLREAGRVLSPGGMLLLYVAAIGLGSGDETRTVPYAPAALRTLLEEAGFEGIEVEAPGGGRNSVAYARVGEGARFAGGEVRTALDGDTQLSTAFQDGAEGVELELTAESRRVRLAFDLPMSPGGDPRLSVCARALSPGPEGTELQLWIWRGTTPVLAERLQLGFAATELTVDCGQEAEHVSVWAPAELSIEPAGDAYARAADLPAGAALSEAERGAEGRRIVVERRGEEPVDAASLIGPVRNRFLVRRASGLSIARLDSEWLAGRLHGIVFDADELMDGAVLERLLWAGWRQALVFLEAPDWSRLLAATEERIAAIRGPLVLVDPALARGAPASPLPPTVAELAAARSRVFVLLGGPSKSLSAAEDLARLRRQLLPGGKPQADRAVVGEASETLRHLTERTILMALRQRYGRSWAEVGRRADRLDG